jgi:hypothetical protein
MIVATTVAITTHAAKPKIMAAVAAIAAWPVAKIAMIAAMIAAQLAPTAFAVMYAAAAQLLKTCCFRSHKVITKHVNMLV